MAAENYMAVSVEADGFETFCLPVPESVAREKGLAFRHTAFDGVERWTGYGETAEEARERALALLAETQGSVNTRG